MLSIPSDLFQRRATLRTMNSPGHADVGPTVETAARLGASGDPIAPTRIDLSPVKVLLQRIIDHYAPEEVWLFGSRARGDARPKSDWDLIVLLRDESDESELDPLTAWDLQRSSGVYADVIPCRISEFRDARDHVNTLAYIVAREGVRLYAR